MNSSFKLATVAASLALVSACAGTPVSLGPSPYVPPPAGTARPVEAKACGFQLLLLLPIAINDRQERAYRQVLAQAGGDYLTDIQWKDEWFYGVVGTGYCTTLAATAIRATPVPPPAPVAPAVVPAPAPANPAPPVPERAPKPSNPAST